MRALLILAVLGSAAALLTWALACPGGEFRAIQGGYGLMRWYEQPVITLAERRSWLGCRSPLGLGYPVLSRIGISDTQIVAVAENGEWWVVDMSTRTVTGPFRGAPDPADVPALEDVRAAFRWLR